MKAILLTIAALWAVVLGIVLLLVLLRKPATKPTPTRPTDPFTCQTLEARVKQCEPQLLKVVDEILLEKRRKSRYTEYGSAKRMFIQSYIKGEIKEGKVSYYCKLYIGNRAPRIEELVRGVKRCYTQPGCQAFAHCLQKLAAKANLPL